jgi:hypothetical protein
MNKFEIGKTYATRSIGDYNCIIRATVVSRTAKMITTDKGEKFRVKEYNGVETFRPWGNYSLCPILFATDSNIQ